MKPTATLRELQKHLANTDYSLHEAIIACIFCMSGLWNKVARPKPFQTKNIHAQLNHLESTWQNLLGSEEQIPKKQ